MHIHRDRYGYCSAIFLCLISLNSCISPDLGRHRTRFGIYFLEPYAPAKTPVLFVHGMNGSPADFAYLLQRLDRSRFQPWLYVYPSGIPLDAVADRLDRTVMTLQMRFRFGRLAVVAHSVGGLVSRDLILRYAPTCAFDCIPLFVSISTPWSGHAAAGIGAKYSPVVVPAWRDIAPDSQYLQQLFATALPASTHHCLIFTYSRNKASYGDSNDRTVSLTSQLSSPAQRGAARLVGFDDTHTGVLRDPAVASLLDELLADAFPPSKLTDARVRTSP